MDRRSARWRVWPPSLASARAPGRSSPSASIRLSPFRTTNGLRGDARPAPTSSCAPPAHVLVERREFAGVFEDSAPISTMLTSRELQIAYSVADGKCDKVIAYELGISEYTVREHMRRIFHKLKVSKRAALVAQLVKTRFDNRVAESR